MKWPGLEYLGVLLMRICLAWSILAVSSVAVNSREFINLQVLDPDITTAHLLEAMKEMSLGLGVDCRACHRTDIRDYASDEIPEKVIAREMMRLVERVNRERLEADSGDTMLSCMGCHRGRISPPPNHNIQSRKTSDEVSAIP